MGIVIRQGQQGDFEGLLAAEKLAWGEEAGVDLITPEQFDAWLEVFPEGLMVAEHNGQIVGHLYSQICNFNPLDMNDNRSWYDITDSGFCRTTHNPNAQTLYTVSVSACFPGVGKRLLRQIPPFVAKHGLRYYAGASSLPGAEQYAAKLNQPINRSLIENYMAAVLRKLGMRDDPGEKIGDPVVTVTLGIEGAKFLRVLENYFHYSKSGDFAALIFYENPVFV